MNLSFIEQLKNAEKTSRFDLFTEYMRVSLAEFLEFDDKNEIAIDQDFVELGVSSMESVNFKTQLEKELGCALKTTLFFDYPTLDVLVHYMLKDVLGFEVKVVSNNKEEESITNAIQKEEDIVIIAIDSMFPDAMTPDKLWEESIKPYENIENEKVNKSFVFNEFPTISYNEQLLYLGVTESEFACFSKQQKIAYTTIGHALTSSNIVINDLNSSKTGVFFVSDRIAEDFSTEIPYQIPLANEISFRLNFSGPSEIINTFCSSIYVAMHRAIQSIQAHECEQAIIGGVNTISKKTFENLANKGVYNDLLSNTNSTFSFSNQANGFIRSEGAGAILLTTMSKAIKIKAPILAVIKSTMIRHGGKNFSLEAPKATGIKNTITSCVNKSNINVDTIDYIEAHGIANPLADAIELSSINEVYTSLSSQKHKKWHISTVKPIVGHPELVSGIASLVKVIKAFEHEIIPGISNLQTINSEISVNHNLTIQKSATHWEKKPYPKRAALNSYAIGGVNAHVILEKYNEVIPDGNGLISTSNTKNQTDFIVSLADEDEVEVGNIIFEVFNLKLEEIDTSLSPIDYGFDSIKIVQCIRRINETFSIDIKIGEALGMDSFDEFFTVIASKNKVKPTTQNKVFTEVSLSHNFFHHATLFQKGLWLAHELDPYSTTYNLPIIFSVEKDIKSHLVIQTIAFLLEKHPVLRVYFKEENGEVVQKMHPISNCLQVNEDVFTTSPKEEFIKIMRTPFDLQKDCLLRTYKRTDQNTEKQFLIFIIHHTILDGLSGALFMKLFWETYQKIEEGAQTKLQEPNTHFFDFATWEYQYMNSPQAEIDLLWWKNKLSDSLPMLLPYDHSINISIPNQEKDVVTTQIKGSQLQKLKETAIAMKVSLSTLFLASFKILLHKLTLQENIAIATPTEGRRKTVYEDSLGCFVNVILVKSKLDTQKTLLDNILGIKESALSSLDHSAYPLTSLLAKFTEESNTIDIPVSYTYQNIFDAILETEVLKDTIVPIYDVFQETQDEYAMEVYDFRDTLQINFKYKKLLFEKQTVEKHLQYFTRIVDQIITNKELLLLDLKLIYEEEEAEFLTNFNKTNIGFPEHKTIVNLFEEQARKTPNNIAITFDNQQINYHELNNKANQLAHFLRKNGIQQKDKVVLCLDRSINMLVSILAVLKTGATYVPVDPSYPTKRIQYTIDDVQPKSIICSPTILPTLKKAYPQSFIIHDLNNEEIKDQPFENLNLSINPEDPMYIIYTSGTTGQPKGVIIKHSNVVRLFKTDEMLFDFNEKDVWTLFHSYCFDFSVWEMYGALLSGGRLVIVSDEVRKDAVLLYELLATEKVTVLNQTPSSFNTLLDQLDTFTKKVNIRYVIFGGEALQPQILKQWHTLYPNCKLINMYGITETTVHVTYQEITAVEIDKGISTIGTPIPTLSCYVMDNHMNLVPNGVVGELYVGGHGVAKGYLNRPNLNKERFIENPFQPNTKMYKTGDIVKYNYQNQLEYIGRIDEQVKIRGYRIELGEIETVLLSHPNVLKCVVIVNETENKHIIAYLKLKEDVDKQVFIDFLEDQIPQYMVPSFIYVVTDFALTTNGKIDKKKLPIPDFSKTQDIYLSATNETENTIVTIFEELLKIKKISILDDFFELGGHSLLVIKATHKINALLDTKLAAKELFKYPTPKKLATRIKTGITDKEVVNLKKELQFSLNLEQDPETFHFPTEPKHIFVTGATGFVGAFLLKELLENTTAKLYCLTRASSQEEAYARIKNVMTSNELWSENYASRIKSIVGDLDLPLLGLSPNTFEHLCSIIDVIYHNAASMNHIAIYEDLKTTNVDGTLEIIKLASKNKIKPLHYTSTLAIFNNTERTKLEIISEKNTSENEIHYTDDGYSASKWIGENMILKAQKAGLPCAIYRLGLVVGDSISGKLDSKQWLYGFIKSSITTGAMINQDLSIKLPMMPVDNVANFLVNLSLKKDNLNQIYHLVGKPTSLYDVFKSYSLHKSEFTLRELSMYEWLKLMKSYPKLSIPPFMLEYMELSPEEIILRINKELKAKLQFNNEFTEKKLNNKNIFFKNINAEISLIYFSYVKQKENLVDSVIA